MWVKTLELVHFRNYEHAELTFSPRLNVFVGDNGAGKTNVLEALYLLSRGKSRRTHQDRDLIQWQAPSASVISHAQSTVSDWHFSMDIRLGQASNGALKSQFKWNGKPLKSRSELIGKCPAVSFFLSDLLMLRGTPDDRRSGLDALMSQTDSAYLNLLTRYQRIKDQKTQLLKQSRSMGWGSGNESLCETLNEQLAELGAQVVLKRLQVIDALSPLAHNYYETISHAKEELALVYQPSWEKWAQSNHAADVANWNDEQCKITLLRAMACVKDDELRQGRVLVGPHRDDIGFFLSGINAVQFASQGQQRSIVLALKLAELSWLKAYCGDEPPILLLDDVMAELDPHRQHQLLMHLDPTMQVFVTTTHLDSDLGQFVSGSPDVHVYHVTSGTIRLNSQPSLRATV